MRSRFGAIGLPASAGRLLRAMRRALRPVARALNRLPGELRQLPVRCSSPRPAAKGRRRSLRLRLSLFFALLMFAAWGVTAVWSWQESRESIDAFFDTQQLLLAKRLATADLRPLLRDLPETGKLLPKLRKSQKGEEEDEAVGFAVFSNDGRLLLSDGENGRDFIFSAGQGFANARLRDSDDIWRIVWMPSLDGQAVIAVGQELEYREDMVLELLAAQMLPWLALLPALLVALIWMLSRGLAPLRAVARNLEGRAPDDVTPIDDELPSEVRPLALALNSLFTRIGGLIQRERALSPMPRTNCAPPWPA